MLKGFVFIHFAKSCGTLRLVHNINSSGLSIKCPSTPTSGTTIDEPSKPIGFHVSSWGTESNVSYAIVLSSVPKASIVSIVVNDSLCVKSYMIFTDL